MKEAKREYLGISYWLVNQLVRRKQIPCSKVGGKYLFRVQALDEYLEKMEQQSHKLDCKGKWERRICIIYNG